MRPLSFRRKTDWLIIGMLDNPPFGWAMFVMTAAFPEGPWTKPVLARHVESDYFHPSLMEGFPAFVHGGYLYAPATSVARNRDFQCLFKAPLEQAELPSAWSLDRAGLPLALGKSGRGVRRHLGPDLQRRDRLLGKSSCSLPIERYPRIRNDQYCDPALG